MNKDFIYEEQKQLIEMWKNKYYEQKEKLEQLENNKDKAIELVKSLIIFWKKYTPDNSLEIGQLENILNILKGDSDE